MDSKLKIKYKKNENKYVVDYAKVKDRFATRFELFQEMNAQFDVMILIDTSMNKADEKQAKDHFFDLKEEESFEKVEDYLKKSGYEFKCRKVKRQVPRTILGFTSGKSDTVEDVLIAINLPKGQITKDLFDYLLCTHDIMIGIDPTIPMSKLLMDFSSSNSSFQRIDEIDAFNCTLVDSHWMAYMYTGFKFTSA